MMEKLEAHRAHLEEVRAEHEIMMKNSDEYKREMVQFKSDKNTLANSMQNEYDNMREMARRTRDNWVSSPPLIPEKPRAAVRRGDA